MARDMMLRHVEGIKDTAAKTAQARALLGFLVKSTESHTSPYAAYLRTEAEFLDKQPDAYLFHDHLEEHNKAYFFQDFIRFASQYGLQFLGESTLSNMWTGNLSKETSQKLESIQDGVLSGHYMDCIVGRSFRETLLVRSGIPITRQLDQSRFNNIRFLGSFKEEPVAEVLSAKSESRNKEYKTKTGQIISAPQGSSQLTIEALTNAFPGSLSLEQLSDAMQSGITTYGKSALPVDQNQLAATLMQWVLSGFIDFRFQEDRLIVRGANKPKVSSWARSQARASRFVTNLRHEMISVSEVDRQIIPLLDGTRDIDLIACQIERLIRSGILKTESESMQVGKKAREAPLRVARQLVEQYGKKAMLMPES